MNGGILGLGALAEAKLGLGYSPDSRRRMSGEKASGRAIG